MCRIFVCLLRGGDTRIAALCNYCQHEEDGRKGKQDWRVISFQLPKINSSNYQT